LRVYFCDHHEIPVPPGHKFPLGKYKLLREFLAADSLFDLQPAPAAPVGTLELAHDRAYIQAFITGTLPPAAIRRIGFPWSPGLVNRTLASAGSTLQAALDALKCGIAGGLAGGTHHAFRAEGAGFCVVNDIAVAIRALQQARLIERAAVVDLDVHQGDGTAAIFSDDPRILTFSMHGANNFPFRKQTSVIDIALADRTGDAPYLEALRTALPRIWHFAPDIVFFQSGVDTLGTDRLGRLSLTIDGLKERDRLVLEGACSRSIPVVITLGGGYSDPIDRAVEAHANTFRTACGFVRKSAVEYDNPQSNQRPYA
jgi:acetoin utilization deacetylase AcuC-like enzyme